MLVPPSPLLPSSQLELPLNHLSKLVPPSPLLLPSQLPPSPLLPSSQLELSLLPSSQLELSLLQSQRRRRRKKLKMLTWAVFSEMKTTTERNGRSREDHLMHPEDRRMRLLSIDLEPYKPMVE